MEFGRLENIDSLTFELPQDAALTSAILTEAKKRSKKRTSAQVFVGCPVWGDKGFIGRIYPKGTKEKDFLKIYSTKFNSIELNATGYKIPSKETITSWCDVVEEGFVFCPKISQQISRSAPLGKDSKALQTFCENIHSFGDHLGATFLQLPPTFSPVKLDQLINFIEIWDSTLPLHIELRHPDWFAEGSEQFQTLLAAMREHKVGTIITDVTDRRDVLHQTLTTPSAFIRFDGHDLHPTDFKRLDDWAERAKQWIDEGLEKLYFFVHTPEKYLNAELADYFIKQLNSLTGYSLTQPLDQK